MLCQLTGRGEGHPTLITEVQLEPLVATGMVFEGTRVGECRSTSCTAVGSDPTVPAPVSGQHTRVCKRLTTLMAQEWTFT